MPEPGATGSTAEMFHCPVCGMDFPTDGEDEKECPIEGHICTRDTCIVRGASDVDF